MAELKDLIPGGNDSNSGDSWFVLSSASEEEDEDKEPETERSNLVQPNLHEEKKDKKEDVPDFVEPKQQPLENSHDGESRKEDSKPLDEIPKMEQSDSIQKDTADEMEQNLTDRLEIAELSEKGAAETMVNDEKSEIPVDLGHEVQMLSEEKEEKQLDKETKIFENKIEKDEKRSLDYKDATKKEGTTLQKDSIIVENEKPSIAKQRRKAKSLLTDEGSHSEIALEVHALRETLIQLSLNLSNMEEEKYSSIASEVQALREAVTQLNNDLPSRISQIEKRTEQVHTLLCRFIMTRCGNYKEPPTQIIATVKEQHPDTSNVAVQTETPEITHSPVLKSSGSKDAVKLDHSKSTDQVSLPNKTEEPSSATDKLLPVNKADDGKKSQSEPKALLKPPELPFKERKALLTTPPSPKEQLDSRGSKRPRLDNNPNEISKEPSHNGTSDEAPSSRQHERSTLYKEKAHRDHSKPKHSKTEHYESFHQHPTLQKSGKQRKRSNRSRQGGNDRKRPYSKQMQKDQDFHSSDTNLGRASSGFLDDFDVDKVIDQWAQDGD